MILPPPALPRPLLLLGLLLLTACGSLRSPAPGADVKQQVVSTARQMLGTPYRYGGDSPDSGFDCSGLVWYSYRQAGLAVPRTSKAQYRQARPVSRRHLQPGDLIFFRSGRGGFVSHVGIYLGEGEFVHAPSSGRKVSIGRLDAPHWRRHFYAAGRLY